MDDLTFEAALAELETTVRRLEDGALSLDEALALYERGVALARLCGQRLDAAELRIQQLDAAEPADDDSADAAWEGEEPF